MKGTWSTRKIFYITKDLRQTLRLLHDTVFATQHIRWGSPISHLVSRPPDAEAWGDASLKAGGGFSLDLRFWWHLEWPEEVRRRTVNQIQYWDYDQAELVTINILEFVVIIINFVAAVEHWSATANPRQPYPVLLNWCDNTSADSWVARACRSSIQGKALGLLLCSYLINCDAGLRSSHLSGDTNTIADRISRFHTSGSSPDFSRLLQATPQLRCCRRYHPNPELVSVIFRILCSTQMPDPTRKLPRGHFDPAPAGF